MHKYDTIPSVPCSIAMLRAEIERLWLENWQLKGALGYAVPGDIPEGPFRCGLCEARAIAQAGLGQKPLSTGLEQTGKQ